MRQRGRIGALQREMMSYASHPNRQATVRHLAPVPSDLKEPERKIWRAVVAQHDFNPVGCSLLESAMRMHEIGRTARKIVAEQGMMIADRNHHQRMHPMLRIERDARYLFHQICKSLHVRMEFDDDERRRVI